MNADEDTIRQSKEKRFGRDYKMKRIQTV